MDRSSLSSTVFLFKILTCILVLPVLASADIKTFDKIVGNKLNIDNVQVDGSVISTSNTNGDLTLTPNGTGGVIFSLLNATTVPYLDASKKLTSSTVTPTELGYSSGVTASLCGISQACTLTNKILTGNTAINLVSGSGLLILNSAGTITVPNGIDTLVGKATTDTLTNKSIDATTNTITNISNTEVKAAAGIAVNKLAALTASRAVVTDGSGFLTQATTTAAEIGFVNGASSNIQAQINALVAAGAVNEHNYVQNGEFRFYQRQAPGVLTSWQNLNYTADRWELLTNSTDNVDSIRVVEATTGSVTRYVGQFTTDWAGTNRFGVFQKIEASNSIALRSKTVTLAFYARTTGTDITTIRACIGEWVGTADAPTNNLVSSWGSTPSWVSNFTCKNTPADITISSSWAQYSITAAFGSSLNNAVVGIWTPNTTANTKSLFLSQVQLVEGSSPITWTTIQVPYEQELTSIQRFHEKTFPIDTQPIDNLGASNSSLIGFNGSTTIADAFGIMWQFKVRKRVSPNCTAYNPWTTGNGFAQSGAGNYGTTLTSVGETSVAYRNAGVIVANGQYSLAIDCDAEFN